MYINSRRKLSHNFFIQPRHLILNHHFLIYSPPWRRSVSTQTTTGPCAIVPSLFQGQIWLLLRRIHATAACTQSLGIGSHFSNLLSPRHLPRQSLRVSTTSSLRIRRRRRLLGAHRKPARSGKPPKARHVKKRCQDSNGRRKAIRKAVIVRYVLKLYRLISCSVA
jgi:hypothetical protein